MSAQKVTYVSLLQDPTIHEKYEKAVQQVKELFGKHHPMHIARKEVFSDQGEFEDRSPMDTRTVLGYFQKGKEKHAKEAIVAAKAAFEGWSSQDWRSRVTIFRKAADIMEQRKFLLAALITFEVGKNRFEAIAEAGEAVDMIRYYCDQMETNEGYVKPMGPGAPGEKSTSVMRPYGVWCVISPFNFPIALAVSMSTGALLTGNTVVFKPTSDAPFSGLELYRAYRDGGVPAGVVNFVTGAGGNFEKEFTSNPDVAGIAFTGSKDVGLKLYKQFVLNQPYPKPFIAELGSKNPTVVTAKAQLDKAVEGVARAAFGYCGQKCSATSRVYVQKELKQAFLERLGQRVQSVAVGDPTQREAFMGPIINERAYDNFKSYMELAKRDKAIVVAGGSIMTEGNYAKGYYVQPTVIDGLPRDHRLFKEELFVPIVLVSDFSTLDEAIRECNNTEYGLTAGIFTEDKGEMKHFFEKIQFGVAYANRKGGATTGAWPGAQSFGGWKASGATGKGVGGPYYLLQFLREQSQTVVEG